MSEGININDLNALILDHIENGTQNSIEKWNFEANHCEEADSLIHFSDVNPKVFDMATSYLYKNMMTNFSQFNPEEKQNYIQSLISVMQEKRELIANQTTASFERYFALLFVSIWGMDENNYHFLSEFINTSINDLNLFIVCIRFIDSMSYIAVEKKLSNFQLVCYLPFMLFTLNRLKQIISETNPNYYLLILLLKLFVTLSTFEYQIDGFKVHFPHVSYISNHFQVQTIINAERTDTVVFECEWPQSITSEDVATLIFESVSNLQPNDLNQGFLALKALATAGTFNTMTDKDSLDCKQMFVDKLLLFMKNFEISQVFQPSFFELTSLLWFTHQSIIEKFPRISKYEKYKEDFVQIFENIQKYVFTTDNFMDNTGSAQNIIWFWSTKDKNYIQIKISILFAFVDLIMDGISKDIEFFISFNDTESNSIFEYVRNLHEDEIWIIFEDLKNRLSALLTQFYTLVDSPDDQNQIEVIVACLSFLINFSTYMSIKMPTNYPPEAMQSLVSLYRTIIDVYQNILSLDPIENCYIQKSLMNFSSTIKLLPFADSSTSASQFFNLLAQDEGAYPIRNSNDLVCFIMKHFILILSDEKFLQNPEILTGVSQCLHKMLMDQNYRNKARDTGVGDLLLTARKHDQFKFDLENQKARRFLHAAIADILTDSSAPLSFALEFLMMYNHAFEAVTTVKSTIDEIIIAIIDFSGYFSQVQTTKQFMLFFDYVFPERIEHLNKLIPQFTDVRQILCLLKFWSIIFSKKQLIVFRKHSPNGVLFFKSSARMIKSILENHSDNILKTDSQQIICRYIILMSRIIEGLLDNNFVPYSVFKIFNDPVLVELISDSGKIITLIELDLAMDVEKVANALLSFVLALCKNHINIAIESTEGQCGPIILSCIGSYILHATNIVPATTVLSNLVNNINDISVLDKDSFDRLYRILWGNLYTNNATVGAISNCIYDIWQVYPESLDTFYETAVNFASNRDEFTRFYQEFRERIEVCEKTTFNSAVSTFVSSTKALITAPEEAFK
ncbi:hypothetical protein TVAG_489660 [Trichomonas vaginalis G3]|uniref:Uncharacterized protein n=1 Tax=Trichomonas vaginalis (strain ATCC PRA-98 / G3) TaxID=412133 RepID=A2FEK1_TRIV3|nr:nuclear export signal receptor protein [Trichomonas vaginalis G3]EAX96683.1 hypothetical protein TVAG_489660 [Trichomonas vaginalis G3]KAI5501832.1 nuclear export signal receptor protein [Trichomonas vaginalis G3]|eukprot:XP_001309613.1 hypothetical protein [Trichomonas vaginalis G3]